MSKELNKSYNRLIFVGIFLYFALMFAKQIFVAEIIEIQEVFGATATNTSLVTLIYYVVYAISQVALVLYIDKINLRYYLGVTLFVSSMLTILIGFAGNFGAGLPFLFVIFGLNGILQAGNYAGIVRIFSKYLTREKYMLSMKFISISATVSLASSYALSSLFVALSRWDIPFIITGVIFMISVLLFFFGLKPTIGKIKSLGHVESESVQNKPKIINKAPLSAKTKRAEIVFVICICLIGLLANYLYYGLNSWFSKLMYDVHGIPKHYSILLSVGVSLLSAISCTVAITYYNKARKGYRVTAVAYCLLAVIATALAFTYKSNVVYVVIACLVFICVNQAVKTPYSSVLAYEVKAVIEPGKYSLIFNAMASIAAGCSPTIISIMFENFGWSISFMSLMIVSIILVCVVMATRISQRIMMFNYCKDKIHCNKLDNFPNKKENL